MSRTAHQPAAASSPGRRAPLHLTAVQTSGRSRGSGSAAPARDLQLVALVEDARSGDDEAWRQLTARFDPTMRRIARGFRLSSAQIDDVMQNTWLRLFTSIQALQDPAAVPGWLTTTTRRESLRILQSGVREHLSLEDPRPRELAEPVTPEGELLAAERRAVVGRALATLPARDRALLRLLARDPVPGYREISSTLGMPVGSIGPIRARGLARMQRHPELRVLHLGA